MGMSFATLVLQRRVWWTVDAGLDRSTTQHDGHGARTCPTSGRGHDGCMEMGWHVQRRSKALGRIKEKEKPVSRFWPLRPYRVRRGAWAMVRQVKVWQMCGVRRGPPCTSGRRRQNDRSTLADPAGQSEPNVGMSRQVSAKRRIA